MVLNISNIICSQVANINSHSTQNINIPISKLSSKSSSNTPLLLCCKLIGTYYTAQLFLHICSKNLQNFKWFYLYATPVHLHHTHACMHTHRHIIELTENLVKCIMGVEGLMDKLIYTLSSMYLEKNEVHKTVIQNINYPELLNLAAFHLEYVWIRPLSL